MASRLICRDLPKLLGLTQKSSNILKPISLVQKCNNTRLLSNISKHHPVCSGVAYNSKIFNAYITNSNFSVSSVRMSSGGDHSKLWTAEKAVSAALLGIIPAAIAMPNVILDDVMVLAVVLHTHWGIEAIVVDYIRPIIFGNVIPKVMLGLVYLLSALTLGGLLYFNHNNLGVSRAIRRFWSASRNKNESSEPNEPSE